MPTRDGEIKKYVEFYAKKESRRMGKERKRNSSEVLQAVKGDHSSFLDVGAGRGEMVDLAVTLGFRQVQGTEVVPELLKHPLLRQAEAHSLPYKTATWDVVCCFDVLEHLVPEDVEPAVRELFRVARHVVLISAAEDSHRADGVELHISRRPLAEWEQTLEANAGRWKLNKTYPCRPGSLIWEFRK